jgi:peptidoglycan/xylan/chitin deacetylase (PgdA/CDA1 family)
MPQRPRRGARFRRPGFAMNEMLVLGYHAVSDRWPSEFSVTPARLRAQLELLLRRGYRATTFGEALGTPSASKTVAITFDDGFRSVVERALPILSDLGLPATLFAVTESVGNETPMAWAGLKEWLGSSFEDELQSMSWEQLEQLAGAGWEIGSHTRTHPVLTDLDDASLLEELRGSREKCEQQTGRPCHSLAYPYGSFDDRVVRAAHDAGYRGAATFGGRFHLSDPLRSPRVAVLRSDSPLRFKLKVAPWTRRLRASSAWPALAETRPAVGRLRRRPSSARRP